MADDSVDNMGGALVEGGVTGQENDQDGDSEEISTAVSNVSSSREELTSCSASEVDIDISTVSTPPAQEAHMESVKSRLLTTPELRNRNGEGSLLTPTTHTTGSHFSALTGLESVDSPTKPEQHT